MLVKLPGKNMLPSFGHQYNLHQVLGLGVREISSSDLTSQGMSLFLCASPEMSKAQPTSCLDAPD